MKKAKRDEDFDMQMLKDIRTSIRARFHEFCNDHYCESCPFHGEQVSGCLSLFAIHTVLNSGVQNEK